MQLIKILPDKVRIKTNSEQLKDIKLNDLMMLSDNKVSIICIVSSITGNDGAEIYDEDDMYMGEVESENIIECNIIGSLSNGKFSKSIDVYPKTSVTIEPLSKERFRDIISSPKESETVIKLGQYTNYGIDAFIDGNKFFQRHSAIVGNTGSGKSFTISYLLEKLSSLRSANIILFDVHGEYQNISFCKTIKIGNGGYDFPMWLLPFKDFYRNLLKLKDETSTTIIAALRKCFYQSRNSNKSDDIPIAYSLERLLDSANQLNSEEIETGEFYKTGDKAGMPKTVKGDMNGKLNSLITLLEDKMADDKYKFMTNDHSQSYLFEFINDIYGTDNGNIKVVDLSSAPSDIVPTIIAITAKLLYSVHLQCNRGSMIPLSLICDEAHIYIPANDFGLGASQRRLLEIFETIAKEGRKFGVTLCIASQRPSELNRTIMAQCANFIVMKISNEADKSMIKNMLPESNRSIIDMLSLFSPGDALVIGDSSNITLKIKIDLPKEEPSSNTIDVWNVWGKDNTLDVNGLVTSLLNDENLE